MTTQTFKGIRRGFIDILPVAMFVFPFGVGFGAAAIEHGISPFVATLMSATVMAGAAQFTALEFWSSPLPFWPLCVVVFAVNARHILLGASIYEWMRGLPLIRRHASATMMTDANWAYAIQRHRDGDSDIGILVGSGFAMWIAWVSGTYVGSSFTGVLGDPKTLALDTVMVAFFAAVLVELAQKETKPFMWPWLVAAVVAVLGSWFLPTGWHILAGGIAGGATGAILGEPESDDSETPVSERPTS